MSGKTISITIPKQLEHYLSEASISTGISRSRYIGNILLAWQQDKKKEMKENKCVRKDHASMCSAYGHKCTAIQSEAETCLEYKE